MVNTIKYNENIHKLSPMEMKNILSYTKVLKYKSRCEYFNRIIFIRK